jgi:ABC-2 type transport system ATP-binding protein
VTDAPVIAVEGVSRRFGAQIALEDASLTVPAGRCFGLLGPNGAGKTTLIRILLGLARADAGHVEVCGRPVPGEVRRALARVGGVVEEPRFHGHLSGRENLRFWSALTGDPPAAAARIGAVLARAGLADAAERKVAGYSMGMRQRLGVARALLGDPAVLILDEPSNGLDPEGMAEFRTLLRALADEGRTVFLSSHLLGEVERVCDEAAILAAGRVVQVGAMADLLAAGRRGVQVRCADNARAASLAAGRPGVTRTEEWNGTLFIDSADPALAPALNRELVAAGIDVWMLAPFAETLEQRFLALTAAAQRDRAQAAGASGPEGRA